MSKRGKGSKRYQPAPWSADFDALKRGGVAPWSRKRAKRHGDPHAGHKHKPLPPRGGGR